MPRISQTTQGGVISRNIRALIDTDLKALVTELRFNTKLTQSMLATAVREQRRRKRMETRSHA
jgi:hypothetical protein